MCKAALLTESQLDLIFRRISGVINGRVSSVEFPVGNSFE